MFGGIVRGALIKQYIKNQGKSDEEYVKLHQGQLVFDL